MKPSSQITASRRAEAQKAVRRAMSVLTTIAEWLDDPAFEGEPAVDVVETAERIEAAIEWTETRRTMGLVDAIGAIADSGVTVAGGVGQGYGFEEGALRLAVEAWRAPQVRGRGTGRRRKLWPLVWAAVRSTGATPPAPESLRKQHERWRAERGRPARFPSRTRSKGGGDGARA
jgi:hypothetical protein